MIAGMIQLEDYTILWENLKGEVDGAVHVTVSDGMTGAKESYQTFMGAFSRAMCIAMTGDTEDEGYMDIAEGAMPTNPVLRWIP